MAKVMEVAHLSTAHLSKQQRKSYISFSIFQAPKCTNSSPISGPQTHLSQTPFHHHNPTISGPQTQRLQPSFQHQDAPFAHTISDLNPTSVGAAKQSAQFYFRMVLLCVWAVKHTFAACITAT